MAKIISFREYVKKTFCICRTYFPLDGVVSIDLDAVRKLSSRQADYPQKKVKTDRSFLSRLLLGWYDIEDDESKPYYELTFEYKNHREVVDEEEFLIDKEEYERLKPELAKYGWTI